MLLLTSPNKLSFVILILSKLIEIEIMAEKPVRTRTKNPLLDGGLKGRGIYLLPNLFT